MAKIVNEYRYTITDRLGNLIAQPIGESDFSIEWNRDQENGKRQYQREFGGNIIFIKEAYQRLLLLETSMYRCEFQSITIERKCDGQWNPWFEGQISLNEGEWDLDACMVTLKFEETKPDECFENNKSETVNLFSKIYSRRTVNMFPGNVSIETEYCQDYRPGGGGGEQPIGGYYWCGTGDSWEGGWTAFYHEERVDDLEHTVITRWARQVMEVDCDITPSPDWILIEDTCGTTSTRKYARPVNTYDCTYQYNDDWTQPDVYYYRMDCKVFGQSGAVTQFRNGMPLESVINAFLNDYCPGLTLKSDFFQFNPDNASTINYVTNAESKVRNIMIFQKSDIKRPNASGSASRAEWTWEKLMTTLKNMFNVEWRIVGDQFVIEHVSWFGKGIGMNLKAPRFKQYVAGKRKYTYKNEDIPRQERWLWKEQTYGGDFPGQPITYTSGCVTTGSKEAIKTYAMDDVITDIEFAISNPAPDSSVVSDDGFVFVATEYDGTNYYIITEAGILENSKLNNSLAVAQLQRDYHKYERPLRVGRMNGVETEFFSVIPTKQGETIAIPFCCGDNFNPDDLVITPLGAGTVDKATFNFKGSTLELDLLYEANANLEPNQRPTVTNKIATTYQNEAKIIDVLDGWSDPDPDAYPLSVVIVNPPTNGTVEVLPDLKVRYNPNPGYNGNDLFTFRMKDNWGAESNNGLVNITVYPENQPPVANDDFYSTFIDQLLHVNAPGVFANDSDDVDFELDSYQATSANGGAVTIGADGTLDYTPPTGFEGTDTFTYTIIDEKGLTDTATVSVLIRDRDDPIAVADTYMTRVGFSFTGTPGDILLPGLLDNDYTPSGATPLTATAVTFPTDNGGTVAISADGGFNYTPPGGGWTGVDTFTYQVHNSHGSDIGTATVRVIPNVYVKLVNSDFNYEGIYNNCGQGQSMTGEIERQDYTFQYFSDAAGTTPLDISTIDAGGAFPIHINDRLRNEQFGSWMDSIIKIPGAGGTTWLWRDDYVYRYYDNGCTGDLNSYYERSTLLLSAPHYITI